MPTDVSARGGGVANFLDELRSLGALEILNQPASDMNNVGYWQLRLVTESEQEEFSDQIDFIAENSAWRVVEESMGNDDSGVFGIFGDSPGAPEEDQGYGFFAPLDSVVNSVAAPQGDSADDQSYGFRSASAGANSPLPVAEVLSDDSDGYGFSHPYLLLRLRCLWQRRARVLAFLRRLRQSPFLRPCFERCFATKPIGSGACGQKQVSPLLESPSRRLNPRRLETRRSVSVLKRLIS